MKLLIIEKNKIYYEVETLIFGQAIKQATNPSRIIVGSKNKEKNR